MNLQKLALALCAALLPAGAAAQTLLPAPQTAGDVRYLSGGVGSDERRAMRDMAKDYNLRVTLVAGPRGAYLSGAALRIAREDGSVVLETQAEGPWFFARLPDGRYRVSVTHDGSAQTRAIDLRQRPVEILFRWEGPVEN